MNGDICELWFDGATEPVNPGGWMCMAWIIRAPGFDDITGTKVIPPAPENTNNIGEWSALIEGIMAVAELPEHRRMVLQIRGDSALVVNQLNQQWNCNKPHLAELRDRALQWLRGITWRAQWIPREQNERADSLTRQAYEQATGKAMPERQRKIA